MSGTSPVEKGKEFWVLKPGQSIFFFSSSACHCSSQTCISKNCGIYTPSFVLPNSRSAYLAICNIAFTNMISSKAEDYLLFVSFIWKIVSNNNISELDKSSGQAEIPLVIIDITSAAGVKNSPT